VNRASSAQCKAAHDTFATSARIRDSPWSAASYQTTSVGKNSRTRGSPEPRYASDHPEGDNLERCAWAVAAAALRGWLQAWLAGVGGYSGLANSGQPFGRKLSEALESNRRAGG